MSSQGESPEPEAGPLGKRVLSDIGVYMADMGRGGGRKYGQGGGCGATKVLIWRSPVHEVAQRV